MSAKLFAVLLITCACLSAALASWLPLQVSIAAVFLFAGPHNWFEARYFLMRLPARFGRSRNFFAVAFAGIFLLTIAYVSLPALYYTNLWSAGNWPIAIGTWNTLMILWLGALVLLPIFPPMKNQREVLFLPKTARVTKELERIKEKQTAMIGAQPFGSRPPEVAIQKPKRDERVDIHNRQTE